jgi:hypothetical protein
MIDATFEDWFGAVAGSQAAAQMKIAAAFSIAVCRVEEAARGNANDPLQVLRNTASESSRRATKSMLGQLGYSSAQTRVMQRVLAGSTGGWPGMIRLYLASSELSRTQQTYLRRQIRQFATVAPEPVLR